MVRIDFLVFGYRKIAVSPSQLSVVTSALLRAGISAAINSKGEFCVRERDLQKTKGALDGKVEYELSELLGLYGAYKKINCKRGLLCGIVLSLVICVLASSVVWDVRVEGNESIPDAAIVYELSKCGFSQGGFWSACDKSDIEALILSKYPSLSWININRRGTVAYVTVSEQADDTDEMNFAKQGYANVVASCDCVIEEITVSKGTAVVKIGDAVKKGDVLISGVVETENGGEYCYAEGRVIGRMSDTVKASAARSESVKTKGVENLLSFKVEIFNFPINILKRYRNLSEECDIIDNVRVLSIFGKCNLPIKFISTYSVEYEYEQTLRSDADLVRLASARLNSATMKRLVGADLIKVRTYGDYTDEGYEMYSRIVFLADVGEPLPFTIE